MTPIERPGSRVNGMNSVRTGARAALLLALFLALVPGCATAPATDVYHSQAMDFPSIQRAAVLPFVNLSSDSMAAERVRDVFANALLATEAFYVLPSGEVARGVSRAGIRNAADPSPEEIVRFGQVVKADAVITGVVREYGQVRSGSISANSISVSLKMIETETGAVVWSSSSTKGGITTWTRLFGGGPSMSEVTREAVEELLDNLFL